MADKLKIYIDGDDNGFRKTLKEIGKTAEKELSKTEDSAKDASEKIDDLGDKSKKSSKGVDDLGDKSKKTSEDVDGLGDESKETSGQVDDLGDKSKKTSKLISNLGSAAKGAVSKGLGIAVKGMAVASAGVAALATASVKSYSEYEQLVGGVETLFKDSASIVQKYANDAYRTAGVSANDYMQNVTSFSAALIKGCGGDTEKAAELANMAMMDMSDNANKFGSDISTIQTLYQGLAKEQYMLLDNLKLPYAGTKEGAEKLVNDAAKIDESIKKNDISFANMVKAIHVVQENMGIAGTTAEEAATTIQGSLGMVKASWENLLTGLADPEADIGVLLDNVINSVTTLGENLEPAIETVLEKIPTMLGVLGEKIIGEIPNLVNTILPSLVDTAGQLINTLSTTLSENASTIGTTAIEILMTLVDTILENAPTLLQTGLTLIVSLAQGLTESIPELIPTVIDAVFAIVDTFLDNIDQLIDAGIELLMALTDGLVEAIPSLIEKVPEIIIKLVQAFVRNYPKMAKAGADTIGKFLEACWAVFKTCWTLAGQYLYDYVIKPIADKGKELIGIGKNMVAGLWDGFKEKFSEIIGKIKGLIDLIPESIKKILGIHSPSKVMREEVGKMISLGIAAGIDDGKSEVQKAMEEINKTIAQSNFEQSLEFAKSTDEIWMIKQNEVDGLLDSEKEYLAEKARLEKEHSDKEYQDKINNAKDAKEIEKIKQERIEEEEKKGQDAYLENLKLASEKERKIYEALQKDIEKLKQKAVDNFTAMAEAAMDSIEELESTKNDFKGKLDDYTSLYYTYTLPAITINGESVAPEFAGLTDLSKQNEKVKQYVDKLKVLRERGEIPKGIINEIREMPVERASLYLDALLKADDEAFNKYIEDYKEGVALREESATLEFSEDAAELGEKIAEDFKEIPADFWGIGEDSASQFGDGFIEQFKETWGRVKQAIFDNLSTLSPQLAVAVEGGDKNFASQVANNITSTFNINGPVNQSTRERIKANQTALLFKAITGGYNK